MSEFLFVLYDSANDVLRASIQVPREAIQTNRMVELNTYIDKRYYASLNVDLNNKGISILHNGFGAYADYVIIYAR